MHALRREGSGGRVRVAVALLAGALVAGGLAAPASAAAARTTARAVAGGAGIGDPYFPLDGNGGIDVLHYAIRDTYAFDPARLSGTTTLRIRATKALSSFHLDFLLPVSAVSVDGTASAFSRPQPHELVITPSAAIAKGRVVDVTIAYAGDPRAASYAGESNWLASTTEVVAMNEPHMAPWWFPSNDHPSDKASFDVSITTAADKQVIGNGRQVSRTVHGDLATTHWQERSPMATYLAFFAAGHYLVRTGRTAGIPWTTAVSRDISGPLFVRARSIVRHSGAVTDWLAEQLGRYPFDSTGGLVTSLDPGFALENQTRPTYPRWIDHSTLVHELAHQWFGDSVSLRRWRDVWLNEGFATFMEQLWNEKHGGPSTRAWLHEEYADHPAGSGFWKVSVASPGVANLWGAPVYERGAMTLAALRDRIGEQDFHTLLRRWVARHRHGNATTAQFEALAHQVSGQRLHGFFTTWLVTRSAPARSAGNGW